jgi:hypothetical protein
MPGDRHNSETPIREIRSQTGALNSDINRPFEWADSEASTQIYYCHAVY